MQDSLVGTIVDNRYRITALLGRGGMATVYRARDKRLERDVAIKLMHTHLAEKPDLNARFNKEARAAAQLSNSHVVAIHDQGVWASPDGPRAYLVMEYVAGPDARSELQRLGSFNLGTALTLTEQVLHALDSAHQAGIVHRDVKPENILLSSALPPASIFDDKDINSKVADFGLAHVVDSDSASSSTVLGTVAYIPPEAVSSGSFEPPADLYALGIMLYEFLTGTIPFKGETPIQTAYKHIKDPMPRVRAKAEWMPECVDDFIEKLTEKDPHDRPAHARAALVELAKVYECLNEEDLTRRVPVSPAQVPAEQSESSLLTQPLAPQQATSVLPDVHDVALVTPTSDSAPTPDSDTELISSVEDNAGRHQKRPWLRPLILLAVLALFAGVGTWYFMAGPGQRVAVPNVANLSAENAEIKLKAAGFTVQKTEAFSDTVAKNFVIRTDPSAPNKARIHSTITLIISLGIEQVQIPDVVGHPLDDARDELTQARLKVTIEEAYSDTVEQGKVASQSLEAGRKVDHDSPITIVVSKGREPVPVTSFIGKSRDEAVKALEEAGLTVNVAEAFSDTIPRGMVSAQTPSEGTLYKGDKIDLVISLGPEIITVPHVVGMTLDQARSTLEALGLKVEEHAVAPGLGGSNKVLLQIPSAGTQLRNGSTVKLYVH